MTTTTATTVTTATTTEHEPEQVGWGGGIAIPGTPFRTVIAADETDGGVVGLAADMAPGERVPPHVHDDAAQVLLVVAGTVGCRVGGRSVLAGPGAVVTIPRGTEHELWNPGTSTAHVVDLYTPAGIEEHFARVGRGEVTYDG